MADEEEMMKQLEAMYVEEDKKKAGGSKAAAGKAGKKSAAAGKAAAPAAGQEANQENDVAAKKKEDIEKNGVPAVPTTTTTTTKTNADKRKEKKEREKAKKAANDGAANKPVEDSTEKLADKQEQQEKQQPEEKKPADNAKEPSVEKADNDDNAGDAAGEDGKAEDKEMSAAKKKKLKKKEKEKEKKAAAAAAPSGGAAAAGGEAKKPTSAVAKLIKQQLEKQREEEEKLRRKEEEAERKREEERQRREEEERLERERKERRKQKEKERKKRLKEEGKFLTQKQKQDMQRLQQMIQLSGVELPAAGEEATQQQEQQQKKKPKYEKLKRHRPAASQATQESSEPKPAPVDAVKAADEAVPESWEDAAIDTTWDKIETKDEWAPVATPKNARDKQHAEAAASDDDEDDSDDDDEESDDDAASSAADKDDDVDPIERARQRIAQRRESALAKAEASVDLPDVLLRCPLVCVLGHVDTGKTSILDKLRKTHVQDGEAGGITQQIGATNVPAASILLATRMVKSFNQSEMRLPGLLIIDTPGHESFSNLRSRGSSLCDVAILVVDIMHGIEPQTIESIQLLKDRGTPFIVALNKIDRLYDWQRNPNVDVYATLKKQAPTTRNDFQDRLNQVVAQFAMQELNVCLSSENKNFDEYISLVPTSAHSGDGMGNLMAHICELALRKLKKRLVYHEDLEATVMEVKEITGLGTTIDVCLVNGKLREAETIVLAGQEGPIVTQIRGLLMPAPMKELRVKNQYEKFKEVKGAQAVKIIAKDLEKALAGLPLYSTKDADEIEVFKADVSAKLSKVLKSIEVQDSGVYVQASTLGSLEALLLFLRTEKIPYCGINIGPVHKRDVTKCSIMLEKDPQWAVILAFDVKVEREAQELADSQGVKIFTADIIYHLSDAFMKWRDDRIKAEREKYKDVAVFPCKLRILPQYIFNSRDPIVCGVVVEAGILKVGTPISVPSKECAYLGRVESLELNHKKVDEARRGAELCIKIAAPPGDAPKMYGRHFDHNDLLMSRVSRESIDALKQYFRDDLGKEDWKLVIELKKAFNVY